MQTIDITIDNDGVTEHAVAYVIESAEELAALLDSLQGDCPAE